MELIYRNLFILTPILFVIFAKTAFDFWIIFSLLYQHALSLYHFNQHPSLDEGCI